MKPFSLPLQKSFSAGLHVIKDVKIKDGRSANFILFNVFSFLYWDFKLRKLKLD